MTTTQTTLREADGPVLVSPAEVAPAGPRLLALAVDQALVVAGCLVTTAVWLAFGGAGRSLLVVWLVTGLLVEAGQAFAEAVSGATLGGAIAHVRTVSVRTGWPAGLIAVVVRRLVLAAAGVVVPVLGTYVVASSGAWNHHPTRRGWHDWAADTLVLRDWAVPDQWGRAAERARRQAVPPVPDVTADESGSSVPHAPTSATKNVNGAAEHGATGDEEPAASPGPVAEPTSDLTNVWPIVVPLPGPAPVPPGQDEPEPVGSPCADHVRWEHDESRCGRLSEPIEGVEGLEHPRARHRATVLGLGRPLAHAPSGRHRVPEIPTQRTAPRAWPVRADDLEPTGSTHELPDGLQLVFDSGVRVDVVGHGVVGRDLTGVEPLPEHVVVVDDPKRTVSRVHLRFGPQAGPGTGWGQESGRPARPVLGAERSEPALWVMDENSTNGTVLIRPDGAARVLPAGVQVAIGAGWQIRFGEHVAVVERSSPMLSPRSAGADNRMPAVGPDNRVPAVGPDEPGDAPVARGDRVGASRSSVLSSGSDRWTGPLCSRGDRVSVETQSRPAVQLPETVDVAAG